MAYCTVADVRTLKVVANVSFIDAEITALIAEVDSYIDTRLTSYINTLPMSPVPAIIKRCSMFETVWEMIVQQLGALEEYRFYHDEAESILKKITSGETIIETAIIEQNVSVPSIRFSSDDTSENRKFSMED